MDFLKGILFGVVGLWLYYKYKQANGRKIRKLYDLSNTDNQLKFINDVELYADRPINKEAYKSTFVNLEKLLKARGSSYRILAEVSLGAFIKTKRKSQNGKKEARAFSSYNSKRIDFLIIDMYGEPVLGIEYHGSGHYQGNAENRDKVKRLALKKAGVPLYEIQQGEPVAKIKNTVAKILKLPKHMVD